MAGAGGQYTLIVPMHDLVVVRLGHYRGEEAGGRALWNALRSLGPAVPPAQAPRQPPAAPKRGSSETLHPRHSVSVFSQPAGMHEK